MVDYALRTVRDYSVGGHLSTARSRIPNLQLLIVQDDCMSGGSALGLRDNCRHLFPQLGYIGCSDVKDIFD